jgi:hypothetical protein
LLRDIPLGTGFLAFFLETTNDNPGLYKGNEYFVSFSDFNGTVAGYKGIDVRSRWEVP